MSRRLPLCGAVIVAALALVPAAAPAPAPERVQGAIVVVAGNIDPRLLRRAGVTHVAVALTDENLRDFASARWAGFVRGGFQVARRRASSSSPTSRWMRRAGTSISMASPVRTNANGPPTKLSGATCRMQAP